MLGFVAMLRFENKAKRLGHSVIAGVDEAGRGPLAGPVVAAAVVLPDGFSLPGLTDSKKLSANQREQFYSVIHEKAVCAASFIVEPEVIDSMNILRASLMAMEGALSKLSPRPDYVIVDGNRPVKWAGAQRTLVKGDSLSLSVAAASVVAKVERDMIMRKLALAWPEYGFDRHKGYAVAEHLEAIVKHGPCPAHRKTFRGVRERLPAKEREAMDGQMELTWKG